MRPHRSQEGRTIAATQPDQIIGLFAASFNAGDVDGLAALYEDGASIIKVYERMAGVTLGPR